MNGYAVKMPRQGLRGFPEPQTQALCEKLSLLRTSWVKQAAVLVLQTLYTTGGSKSASPGHGQLVFTFDQRRKCLSF